MIAMGDPMSHPQFRKDYEEPGGSWLQQTWDHDAQDWTPPEEQLTWEGKGKVRIQYSGVVLNSVHPSWKCDGDTCVIHKPSNHHMRGWPLDWMDRHRGIGAFSTKTCFHRQCPHGNWHIDPDEPDAGGYNCNCDCGCCYSTLAWDPADDSYPPDFEWEMD